MPDKIRENCSNINVEWNTNRPLEKQSDLRNLVDRRLEYFSITKWFVHEISMESRMFLFLFCTILSSIQGQLSWSSSVGSSNTNVEHRPKSRSTSIAAKDLYLTADRTDREGWSIIGRDARQLGLHSWQTDKLTGSKVVRLIARNGEYKSAVECSPRRRRRDEFITLVSLFRVRRSPMSVLLWYNLIIDRITVCVNVLSYPKERSEFKITSVNSFTRFTLLESKCT